MTEHTGIPIHSEGDRDAQLAADGGPDYELADTMALDRAEQYQALFDETRATIVTLLLERAATVSELAATMGKPSGTIGHHVAVLESAGLIKLVRTEKVRAIEAKYFGRAARTYLLGSETEIDLDVEMPPNHFLTTAAAEYDSAGTSKRHDHCPLSTLRYARIPEHRVKEWVNRIGELMEDFVSEPREGEVTYGLLVAFYPTDRPHLPDRAAS